jgi:hypothetical protein
MRSANGRWCGLALLLAMACGGSNGGGVDAGADAGTETVTEAGTDADTGTDTGTETATGTETDTGPDPDTNAEAVPDTGSDAGPDANPLAGYVESPDWPTLCLLDCADDAACGGLPNRCLTFSGSGQRFCAVPCRIAEPHCPDGFACVTAQGAPVCVPDGGDCRYATLGVACGGGDAPSPTQFPGICKNQFPACVEPGAGLAYCTAECATDADCPVDYRCDASICRGLWEGGAEGCELGGDCDCSLYAGPVPAELLSALGLDGCDLGFPHLWLNRFPYALGHDAWRLPLFDSLHDGPGLRVPLALDGVDDWVRALSASPGPLSGALEDVFKLMDWPPAALDPPHSSGLAAALYGFLEAAGAETGVAELAEVEAALPPALAAQLVPLVDSLTQALWQRRAIDAALGDPAFEQLLFDRAHSFVAVPHSKQGLDATDARVQAALTGGVPLEALLGSALAIAKAVEGAQDALPGPWGDFHVVLPTPAGAIVFSGDGDDVHNPTSCGGEAVALLVDTGGDDTYLIPAGANVSLANAVSVVLDLGGADTYGYVPTAPPPDPLLLPDDGSGRYSPSGPPDQDNGPVSLSDVNRQGSGRLGIGLLLDLGDSDDVYTSLRLSQGCGVLGVGVLFDQGGNDTYQAEAVAQGAGVFGVGLLLDGGGDDQYTSFTLSQGFGYARSAGWLADLGGKDEYLARPGDPELGGLPLYYNPQNPGKSNSSMSQGMGFGRRADTTDQVFMSGGVGLLSDAGAGDDTYAADIFAQGCGYWFGTGALLDQDGNDHYDGRWYVQGSAAHFANGLFQDLGGNDVYDAGLPPLATMIGVGHDFSVGWFHDAAGNDQYHAPGLSLGSGNSDGIGLFLEDAGDDLYVTTSTGAFGWANATDYATLPGFDTLRTIGLFVDGAGQDTYQWPGLEGVPVQDSSLWLHPATSAANSCCEKGGGLDH